MVEIFYYRHALYFSHFYRWATLLLFLLLQSPMQNTLFLRVIQYSTHIHVQIKRTRRHRDTDSYYWISDRSASLPSCESGISDLKIYPWLPEPFSLGYLWNLVCQILLPLFFWSFPLKRNLCPEKSNSDFVHSGLPCPEIEPPLFNTCLSRLIFLIMVTNELEVW